MSNCSKTIPTIVEGNSLYEAVCIIKDVADKAIAEAGTTATAAEEAKAAAATAQQTAEAAHEEATTAAASAEQAGERAQAAATAAAKAQADAIIAQTTADAASSAAETAGEKIDGVISGSTKLPGYLDKQSFGTSILSTAVVTLTNQGSDDAPNMVQGYERICTSPGDLEYVPGKPTTIAARVYDTGDILVPLVPDTGEIWGGACATSQKYVQDYVAQELAKSGAAPKTNLTGDNIQADESGAAVSQMSVQCINISGFGGTLGKINYLDLKGEIGTNYTENPSKKLSFDLTGVLGSGGNPGVMGYIPINVYSGTKTHFALAQFDSSTGKMIIDCSTFDPSGGNVWQIFSQHIYYAN